MWPPCTPAASNKPSVEEEIVLHERSPELDLVVHVVLPSREVIMKPFDGTAASSSPSLEDAIEFHTTYSDVACVQVAPPLRDVRMVPTRVAANFLPSLDDAISVH
jgi:hypothetical protein